MGGKKWGGRSCGRMEAAPNHPIKVINFFDMEDNKLNIQPAHIIKEAVVLRMQLQKGTVVIPAIVSFLQKIEGDAALPTRKRKKEERVSEIVNFLQTSKKPVRR